MTHLEESAFGLSADEMEHIRYLEALKQRRKRAVTSCGPRKTVSDGLSLEGQIAMQMAMDERVSTETVASDAHPSSDSGYAKSEAASLDNQSGAGSSGDYPPQRTPQRTYTFSELYRRNNSARMRKDITDEYFREDEEKKRALGGGKVESAMEMVEVMRHGDDALDAEFSLADDEAIAELARINSVEKCSVWMQATVEHRADSATINAKRSPRAGGVGLTSKCP